jgi:hypothetical protein
MIEYRNSLGLSVFQDLETVFGQIRNLSPLPVLYAYIQQDQPHFTSDLVFFLVLVGGRPAERLREKRTGAGSQQSSNCRAPVHEYSPSSGSTLR